EGTGAAAALGRPALLKLLACQQAAADQGVCQAFLGDVNGRGLGSGVVSHGQPVAAEMPGLLSVPARFRAGGLLVSTEPTLGMSTYFRSVTGLLAQQVPFPANGYLPESPTVFFRGAEPAGGPRAGPAG